MIGLSCPTCAAGWVSLYVAVEIRSQFHGGMKDNKSVSRNTAMPIAPTDASATQWTAFQCFAPNEVMLAPVPMTINRNGKNMRRVAHPTCGAG